MYGHIWSLGARVLRARNVWSLYVWPPPPGGIPRARKSRPPRKKTLPHTNFSPHKVATQCVTERAWYGESRASPVMAGLTSAWSAGIQVQGENNMSEYEYTARPPPQVTTCGECGAEREYRDVEPMLGPQTLAEYERSQKAAACVKAINENYRKLYAGPLGFLSAVGLGGSCR